MKTLFATSSTLVTLLLATTPISVGAASFQFLDLSVGTKTCRGCAECIVTSNYPGTNAGGVSIGSSYCVDLNGRLSTPAWGGLLTVDFSPEVPGATAIHWSASDGTWIGGTAPSKLSSSLALVTENGTSTQQWGSPNYIGSWCVANIIQHQKSDPSAPPDQTKAQYGYNISLFDNSNPRKWIGGTTDLLYIQDGDTQGIDSALPSVFEITSGSKPCLFPPLPIGGRGGYLCIETFRLLPLDTDSDPYYMSYYNPILPRSSDEVWDAYATSNQCSMSVLTKGSGGGFGNQWGYDGGARTNNCGFAC